MAKLKSLAVALKKGYLITDVYYSMSYREWCINCILNDNGYDYIEVYFWVRSLPKYLKNEHFHASIVNRKLIESKIKLE